jgi:protein TonB
MSPQAEGNPVSRPAATRAWLPARSTAALLAVLLHLVVLALLVVGPGPRASPGAARAVPALQLVHASVLAGVAARTPPPVPPAPRPRTERAARDPARPAAALPAVAALADAAPTPSAPVAATPAPQPSAAEPLSGAAPVEASTAPDALSSPGPAAAAEPAQAPAPPPAEAVPAYPDHAHCPPADYPLLLRDRGAQGTVWLRVRVEPDGRAGAVQLLKGSGWRLFDEAASRSVRACRFVPAQRGGERLSSWVEFPVRFALNDPNPR